MKIFKMNKKLKWRRKVLISTAKENEKEAILPPSLIIQTCPFSFLFSAYKYESSLTFSSTSTFLILSVLLLSSSVSFLFLTTKTHFPSTRIDYKVVNCFPCNSFLFPFSQVYLRLSVSTSSRFQILSHCDLGFVLLILFFS